MTHRPLPSQKFLLSILSYNHENGLLKWKERPLEMFREGIRQQNAMATWNSRHAGKIAFTARRGGYFHGTIMGIPYSAHRIIFKMFFGEDPSTIDSSRPDYRKGLSHEVIK